MGFAELRERPEEVDNHHTQVEVGNRENDEYRESWGNQTSDVRYAGASIGPPIDLDWLKLKTMVRYRGLGLSFKSRRNLRLRRNWRFGRNRSLRSFRKG